MKFKMFILLLLSSQLFSMDPLSTTDRTQSLKSATLKNDGKKSIFKLFDETLASYSESDKSTFLAMAIVNNNVAAVSFLLDIDQDIKTKNSYPARLAAQNHANVILNLLINNGAKIEEQNNSGILDQPLYSALYYGNKTAVDMLIRAGVNMHKQYSPSWINDQPESIFEYFQRKIAEVPSERGYQRACKILQKYQQQKPE